MKNFKNMLSLAKLIKPLSGYMVLAVLMGALGFLCAISITVLGVTALLDAVGYNMPLTMKAAFICAGAAAVVRGFLKYGEQACNHYIAFKILALIRDKVFTALRSLCPAKLESKEKGNMISIITSDIELLEVFYAHTVSPVLIAILVSGIMVSFVGYIHFLLGVVALISFVFVGAVLPRAISAMSGGHAENFREKSGEMSSFVLESIRGIRETLQYRAGQNKLKEFDIRAADMDKYERQQKTNAGKSMGVTGAIIVVFDIIMVISAAALYMNRQIGFDGMLIAIVALMSSFGPVIALANLGVTLQNTFAAAGRVLAILRETPQVNDVLNATHLDSFEGAELCTVTFGYADTKILDNFNLAIEKGKITGISGKSGSGKSTAIKLLMRFWDVDKGSAEISNRDIKQINTKDLRRLEGYVTQDVHLFQDSIKNNLLIAKPSASDEEIYDACKNASVHDFIMSLPNKYDTKVGELGSTLSGGERQRIGLARAFLHDCPFVLLDEPTSNLDTLNETVILKSIIKMKDERTVVLVSHRASTMKIADKIFAMENGGLVKCCKK